MHEIIKIATVSVRVWALWVQCICHKCKKNRKELYNGIHVCLSLSLTPSCRLTPTLHPSHFLPLWKPLVNGIMNASGMHWKLDSYFIPKKKKKYNMTKKQRRIQILRVHWPSCWGFIVVARPVFAHKFVALACVCVCRICEILCQFFTSYLIIFHNLLCHTVPSRTNKYVLNCILRQFYKYIFFLFRIVQIKCNFFFEQHTFKCSSAGYNVRRPLWSWYTLWDYKTDPAY